MGVMHKRLPTGYKRGPKPKIAKIWCFAYVVKNGGYTPGITVQTQFLQGKTRMKRF